MAYGKRQCRNCGRMVTTNALGRAAHLRSKDCINPRVVAARREAEYRFRKAYSFAFPADGDWGIGPICAERWGL